MLWNNMSLLYNLIDYYTTTIEGRLSAGWGGIDGESSGYQTVGGAGWRTSKYVSLVI